MLQEEGGPKLILLASPIGNLEDVSLRLLDTLKSIEALACEDTRHSQRLLERHGIPRPRIFFSYHEHNEAKAAERVVGLLREGLDVGLMSDAGTPGLSDPGYRAVTAAIEAGFQVSALPGPNAAIMALTISGLPSDSFTFKGFAPRKQGQRQRFIEEDAGSFHSLVFYESPRRVAEFLEDAATVLGGERRAAVCFELTKLHERVERGSLAELAQFYGAQEPRGEACIVIEGLDRKTAKEAARAEKKAAKRARYGLPPESGEDGKDNG